MSQETGFSLHVTIHIDPSNVDKFLQHFQSAYDAVVAEPECRFFEVYQSLQEPGTLTWVENWAATVDWFREKQITKEYYKEYIAATEPMFVKPREAKILNDLSACHVVEHLDIQRE